MPSKKKKYNARFPAGRIKKIMQTDEDVGKVAQAVPVIIYILFLNRDINWAVPHAKASPIADSQVIQWMHRTWTRINSDPLRRGDFDE